MSRDTTVVAFRQPDIIDDLGVQAAALCQPAPRVVKVCKRSLEFAVRTQLQSYIDASESFPTAGSADEYAALFEAAWPNEGDRRTYIDGKLSGAKPSYGHLALAIFMHAGLTKIVWTTNFDPLMANACAKVYDGTGALTTVALDAPELASQVIGVQRWPIEIKLHGDFRSRQLKSPAMNSASKMRGYAGCLLTHAEPRAWSWPDTAGGTIPSWTPSSMP